MNTDVPNVSSTGINDSAKMVWNAIQQTNTFRAHATKGKLQGIPGAYWQGAVNKVINDLWPSLNDRYLTERDQSEEIKLALNRYLRGNRVMVCIRDGGLTKTSTWFIAEHWPELTVTPGTKTAVRAKSDKNREPHVVTDDATAASPVTSLTPTPLDVFYVGTPGEKMPAHLNGTAIAPAKEENGEEEMATITSLVETDDTNRHTCRFGTCEDTFIGAHHRAVHEMVHGFRVNEDGTVTNFDPMSSAPDEEDLQNIIIRVCNGHEPMTVTQIVEAVRKDTPKASKAMARIVLQVLCESGWFEKSVEPVNPDNARTHTRRFRYLGKPAKVVKPPVKKAEKTIKDQLNLVTPVVATADEEKRNEETGQGLKTSVHVHAQHLRNLLVDLETLSSVESEVIRLRENNDDLRRELDVIKADRDNLQGKLDTLKSAFNALSN